MAETNETITRIQLQGKEYILIGTAHVSKHSAEQVKDVIEAERPDSVCIELDKQRYKSLVKGNKWKETDIFKVIKEKKASLMLVNLAISSFQKRIAKQFGIQAGQEMVQGIESAKRPGPTSSSRTETYKITFARIWQASDFGER